MKHLLFVLALTLSVFAKGQQQDYFFLMISPTGKGEVLVEPEYNIQLDQDIDSLIVSERNTDKKGNSTAKGKKYATYTELFNTLSGAGLEFVQFQSLNRIGGATNLFTGDLRISYMIWKRKGK